MADPAARDGLQAQDREGEEMNRELDGIYFRVKRDGKYENICFTDMTDEEINEKFRDRPADWWCGIAMHLKHCINEIGEKFGIRRFDDSESEGEHESDT